VPIAGLTIADCRSTDWRLSIVACLLAAVGCGGTSVDPAQRTRLVSADQRTMDELMAQNETRASEPELADAYATVNAQYFENRLPPVRIRWEQGLDRIGPMIAENFRLEGLTNGKVILLHPALERDPRQLRAVLCHEMVHVALRDRPQSHGAEFQSRLRSLAERGAFDGIVATDAEKQQVKAELETRAANLASELTELRAAEARIVAEAPGLARDVLQDRSWDHNKRVRQHNEAVDEFNRLIAQYNLMITYPDGLDRERLKAQSTVTPAG
jgi:hypothetical protein